MNEEVFNEKVREEAKFFIKNKLIELKEKGDNMTDTERSYYEFFLKREQESKSDKEILNEIFENLINIFNYYLDDKHENLIIYALWVIGSKYHNNFNAFPYLYVNAMKGSAKSRLLKLLSFLCDGKWLTSPTESVLFRTNYMLGLDEMESIAGKEKLALREILNASYKKGITISRTIKRKKLGVESYEIENFTPYRPIAMANISGMDNVLQDRCISIILEKSNNPSKTKLSEDFENDKNIENTKKMLDWCSLCSVVMLKNHLYQDWNSYIKTKYDTLTTQTTQEDIEDSTTTTQTTLYTKLHLTTQEKIDQDVYFNKIDETGLYGRNLELFFPLFIIAKFLSDDIFNEILTISKKVNDEKNKEDSMESIDIMVIDFISKFESNLNFISITTLKDSFKNFSNCSDEWLNSKWFGRALTRLNLIVNKRRVSNGIEVLLNVSKAREKMKMFNKEEVME